MQTAASNELQNHNIQSKQQMQQTQRKAIPPHITTATTTTKLDSNSIYGDQQ